MIFSEYEKAKKQLENTLGIIEEILEEKEQLFTKTQPIAVSYDKPKVKKSTSSKNSLDDYVINLEIKKIEERLLKAKSILAEREKILEHYERKLRKSTDKLDIIYLMRYIDKASIDKIAWNLNYSKSQVYRLLDKIQRSL